MNRQIVLDTETTGIGTELDHRIIEIGCVELIDRKLTGEHFHVYINPEREVDAEAVEVHGLDNAFLSDKPVFSKIAQPFFDFITGAELVIHNAPFDVGFINHEFSKLHWPEIQNSCGILDTLTLARKKHPGQRNSLDALCKRYDIDNGHRTLHGALLDAEILADVYLAMTGGQTTLELAVEEDKSAANLGALDLAHQIDLKHVKLPLIQPSLEEIKQHQKFIEQLNQQAGKHFWQ